MGKVPQKVLPEALKIEYLVGYERHPFGAIVTAQDYFAPPILKWDTEQNRNPFSWYVYKGGSFPKNWNLPENAYVEVDGIALQPNLWNDESDLYGSGTSVIFVLHGAKDTGYKGSGSALFPEVLKSDLREVRSTIEAFPERPILTDTIQPPHVGFAWKEGAAEIGMTRSSESLPNMGPRYTNLTVGIER